MQTLRSLLFRPWQALASRLEILRGQALRTGDQRVSIPTSPGAPNRPADSFNHREPPARRNEGAEVPTTSSEVSLEKIRALTAVMTEVRVGASTLPADEAKELRERRRSIRSSRLFAEANAGRPLQRGR
jgi:hypothetical protein